MVYLKRGRFLKKFLFCLDLYFFIFVSINDWFFFLISSEKSEKGIR
jgi:hypothetical protein